MILEIIGIRDKGNFEKERLVLRVKSSGDIGDYVLTHAKRRSPNSVSPKIKDPLWFPNEMMNADDCVIIYTKTGSNRNRENEDFSHSYFLYWGLDRSIWNGDETPVLMEISSWEMQKN